RDHRDKLSQYVSDPEIAALHQALDMVFKQYETAFAKVSSQAAFYKGNTLLVENLMQQLSSQKIKQWDIWIQNVYLEGSAEYMMLLPTYRKPFQSGAYELRIDAIRSLEISLQKFPTLNNVLLDVQTFLQTIDSTRTTQQQVETQDATNRQNLETLRQTLAQLMHKTFGFLLYKHADNPSQISRYYEMKYLQSPSSAATKTYTKYTVSAGGRITLFDGQLTANSYISLKVKSAGNVKVFSSADTNAALPNDALEANSAEEQAFYANEVSDANGFNWLILVNEGTSEIQIEVAKEEIEPE
ncbi:MAG: hypothetical protein ACKVTZ_15715, partial [Bacteroidia bacterium]